MDDQNKLKKGFQLIGIRNSSIDINIQSLNIQSLFYKLISLAQYRPQHTIYNATSVDIETHPELDTFNEDGTSWLGYKIVIYDGFNYVPAELLVLTGYTESDEEYIGSIRLYIGEKNDTIYHLELGKTNIYSQIKGVYYQGPNDTIFSLISNTKQFINMIENWDVFTDLEYEHVKNGTI